MNTKDILKEIFDNVNTWLHFSEAKNVALVGADIAILALNTSLIEAKEYIGIVLFVAGLIFPLLSFFPRYNMRRYNKEKLDNDNLLFFADIAKYSETEYLKKIECNYGMTQEKREVNLLHIDYAREIVINSRITVYKLSMFKYGLLCSVAFIIYLFI